MSAIRAIWPIFVAVLTLNAWGTNAAPSTSTASSKPSASPLSLHPSEYFDGDDGWWSSFMFQVGTPPQQVRLLPSTSVFAGTSTWVVLAEGCWEGNPEFPQCQNARGQTFTRNQSTSWSIERLENNGLYALNTVAESVLGLTGAAYYGFDTLSLGLNGQGLPTLDDILFAGIGTNDFWLGSLGLSPRSFNFTNLDTPIPSLLGTLVNQSYVPSSTWAYTAGAFYADPQVYGSVTFGGYDRARIDPTQTLSNISFSDDTSRDLVVQLQSLTYNTIGSTPLQASSIYVYIDSLETQLWLPLETCQNFEKAFNLTWDSATELYLLQDDVHAALLAQNPAFTFTIGTQDEKIDITLPYAAFDLNITYPLATNASRYFPLQRAQNDSQYTLGRVFFQAAYVIADYDRNNFTVAQASFPSSSDGQEIVPICAPGNDEACGGKRKSSLSSGAIAGLAAGSAAGLLLLIGGLTWMFCVRLKRRKQRAAKEEKSIKDEKPDAGVGRNYEHDGEELDAQDIARHEMEQVYPRPLELDHSNATTRHELDHYDVASHEIGSGEYHFKSSDQLGELASTEVAAVELEAPDR